VVSRSPEELGSIVGVDLADPAFWDGGLDIVERQLQLTEADAKESGRLGADSEPTRRRATRSPHAGTAVHSSSSLPSGSGCGMNRRNSARHRLGSEFVPARDPPDAVMGAYAFVTVTQGWGGDQIERRTRPCLRWLGEPVPVVRPSIA